MLILQMIESKTIVKYRPYTQYCHVIVVSIILKFKLDIIYYSECSQFSSCDLKGLLQHFLKFIKLKSHIMFVVDM